MTRGCGARGARCAGPYSSGMGDHDRAWWGVDQALYRQIVSNGVEATGARFVNLCQFDAASGVISGVVWAVSHAELAERALASCAVSCRGSRSTRSRSTSPRIPGWSRSISRAKTVVAPFREIVEGTVHPGVALAAQRVLGLRWTLSVPLRLEDAVVGSLAFHFTAEPPRRLQRSAEAFARQVILTLENARLSVELGPADRGAPSLAPARRRGGGADAPGDRRAAARPGAEPAAGGVESPRTERGALGARIPSARTSLLVEARAEIDEIREQEIRRAGYLLHPSFIREGLGPAVRELAGRFEDALEVVVEIEPRLEELDTPVRNALSEPVRLGAFRVVEEALLNVLRHAQAHRAVVRLGLAGSDELDDRGTRRRGRLRHGVGRAWPRHGEHGEPRGAPRRGLRHRERRRGGDDREGPSPAAVAARRRARLR